MRVCRRVCILRARGEKAAAERMRGADLAEALAPIRAARNEDAVVIESRVAAIFASEEERVADAFVLAELLAPAVADLLAARITMPAPPPSSVPGPLAATALAEASARPRPTEIDFIDAMIAQQEAVSPLRRAS